MMEGNFEQGTYQLRQSKWNRVNVASKLFFLWLWPLFYKASRQNKLHFEDVFACPPEDESNELAAILEREWKKETLSGTDPKKARFRRALYRTFVRRFVPIVLSFLFQELVIRVGQAYLLGIIIDYLGSGSHSTSGGGPSTVVILSAVGFVACAALGATFNHFNITLTDHVGLQMKIACSTLIFKKSLYLSQKALHETSVGQVSNLLANDVNRMVDYAYFAHSPVVAPFQLALVTYLLWLQLSWSCLIGLGILFLFIPVQGVMGKLFQTVRSKTAPLTDRRIRIISEIVNGIKLIKMYAYERIFIRLMAQSRIKEVAQIRRSCNLKGVHLSLYYVTSRIVLFVCFISYVYLFGGALTAHKVFVSMALFNIIRIPVTRHLPQSISATAELAVACARIQRYLLLEQVQEQQQKMTKEEDEDDREAVVIAESASASWDGQMAAFSNVSFTLNRGELLTVVGPVGSGKTSLLLSLMKELPTTEKSGGGTITVNTRSIAYVPQKAWLFGGTIQENILFGRPLEEKRFWEVVRVAALETDLAMMPLKERTMVGERGHKLSGGQQARVSLARALYADADLYLLDDPLSALDGKLGRFIVQQCINGYLAAKTVVLVTHQVHLIATSLPQTSVLVLDGHGVQLRLLRPSSDNGISDELYELGLFGGRGSGSSFDGSAHGEAEHQQQQHQFQITEKYGDDVDEESPSDDGPDHQDDHDDHHHHHHLHHSGSKSPSNGPYLAYLRCGFHWFTGTVMLLAILLSQTLSQGCDYLLSMWTEAFEKGAEEEVKDQLSSESSNLYAYIYTGFIVALFLSTLLRATSFFSFCMAASTRLYNNSFQQVLLSPITFFYHTPAGRILNRFSRDIGIIDDYIPMTAFELQISITDVLATLIIEVVIDWTFVFPAIVFLLLMGAFSIIYLRTVRSLKRLEAIARNPIYSHMNTTFEGLTVIRCFARQSYFEQLYYRYQDFHTSVLFSHICATRGFAILVEWLCVGYIAAITALLMTTGDAVGGLNGSQIGLSLSSCILLVGVTSWGVECRADLESHMASVERVVAYTKLHSEFELGDQKEPEGARFWRSKQTLQLQQQQQKQPQQQQSSSCPFITDGKIVFDHVFLSYNQVDAVLKSLDFTIAPRSKVGIVGRSGAGKSSIITALFRLVDITGGEILIDDTNIRNIPLETLRSSISSIPQDPVLFSGTIRSNLDLYGDRGHFTDRQLWQALEEVQLKSVLVEAGKDLDSPVHEGGDNFSIGQKQLLSLARAMLQQNKILILDEATSNLDQETDLAIQQVIRSKFVDCTVITVAHRLATVIDCDQILVLDAGRIVEFGVPHYLLSQNSTFASMVDKIGGEMADHLRHVAKTTYLQKLYR